jgi:hypothetical protein
MQRQSALSITRKEKNRPAKRKYCGTHKDQSRTVRQMPKTWTFEFQQSFATWTFELQQSFAHSAVKAKKKKWQMTTAKKHEYWT